MLGGFVVEGNRATVKLGAGLPTSNWVCDRATRFDVFPEHEALGAARRFGDRRRFHPRERPTIGAVRPLTVRNVVLDGGGANVGFLFANRIAITLDQVVLFQARIGAIWWDYSGGNTFIGCYSRYGRGPAEQVLVEQTAAGDGLVMLGGETDTPVALARLRGCRGGVIQGVVPGRMAFEECDSIVVSGTHQKGQESSTPMLTLRNSRVTFTGCAFYATYDPSVGCIVVDDPASALTNNQLTLNECTVVDLIAPKYPDPAFSPFLLLGTVRAGTRVLARGLQGRNAAMQNPGRWRDIVQPQFRSLKAKPLRTALDSAVGRAVLATGEFLLRRTMSKWEVLPASGGPVVSRRRSGPP